jgi:hypothetical protein
MSWLPDIQWRILAALRDLGGYQSGRTIAERLDEPLYRIRGELSHLFRQQLVRRDHQYYYALTDRGESLSWEHQQQELPI